jgi:uncharacterized DUF497 family protein
MDRIDGFDWDDGNREKCQRHGVSLVEIESVFEEDPAVAIDPAHSHSEVRMRAVGRCRSGRFVFVVFTIRARSGERLIRPISARYMHPKEVRRYEETGP